MSIPLTTRTRTRNNNPRGTGDDGYYEPVANSVRNTTIKFIMKSDNVSGEITHGYFTFPAGVTFGNSHSVIHCVDSTILHCCSCSWSLWTGTCMLGMLVARLAWVSLSDSWFLFARYWIDIRERFLGDVFLFLFIFVFFLSHVPWIVSCWG